MSSPKCPNATSCGLFPALSQTGLLRIWQINYCETTFDRCERYRRMQRGDEVPSTMLPNGENLTVLARKVKS